MGVVVGVVESSIMSSLFVVWFCFLGGDEGGGGGGVNNDDDDCFSFDNF